MCAVSKAGYNNWSWTFRVLALTALVAAQISQACGATTESVKTDNEALPLLTTASAIAQLKRDQAQRGYPVEIRGVVTCVVTQHNAFVLQDATRGVFIRDDASLPRVGELWEVQGVTDRGSFAPIVRTRQKHFLGLGNLPAPVQPTWDQIINGSLDDQLVEVRGVVESVLYDPGGWSYVILRTEGGSLRVDLPGSDITAEQLVRCKKNLVLIQGCFFAKTDPGTWQVTVGQIRIFDAKILLPQSDSADLFSTPVKTAAELMLFDPEASAFRRVKVVGQVIHSRGTEHFMMDGTNGVRFVTTPDSVLLPGDFVEVVGFPRLSRAAPVLTEAVTRKTAHGELPEPKRISSEDLARPNLDSVRVRVEGLLASVRHTQTNLVMEMQAGSWRFLARLSMKDSSPPPLRIGSQLELTGVYCAQGYRTLGEDVSPVDLLLNSPSDIKILTTPSWWTLRRLLVVVGVLACVLVAAMLWITQLHRQVEERTVQLESQIQERQRIEHQHAMEQERARIAQDLHDELGSGLTEITMLAARTKSAPSASPEKPNGYLDQMAEKAHEMVVALDEIVWAMNPTHNSLASVVSYFSLYTDRFLGLAGISWHLENHAALPDRELDSKDRHQLFLAYKEALTNIVRHSKATDVRVGIQIEQKELRITIADNGRGIPSVNRTEEMNGMANMRARIEKLGGRFEISGEPNRGTTIRFCVPSN